MLEQHIADLASQRAQSRGDFTATPAQQVTGIDHTARREIATEVTRGVQVFTNGDRAKQWPQLVRATRLPAGLQELERSRAVAVFRWPRTSDHGGAPQAAMT